jgi:aerobic carbon-monoxide dehydrogenase medium subunit
MRAEVAPPRVSTPGSLDECLAVLAGHGDEAKVIAGGTALMIMLRNGLVDPAVVVSLSRLTELRGPLRRSGGAPPATAPVRLPALVTLSELRTSPVARTELPLLSQAAGLVANSRVRNVATIGGNVCEADYASDPPCVLLALDAVVECRGAGGAREIPLQGFVTDYYTTALRPEELVTAVRVPVPPPGSRGVYINYVTRSVEDRPCVGVAVILRVDESGVCRDLRVAVGATGPVPFRIPEAEGIAVGLPIGRELAAAVADAYASGAEPMSDLRGSAAYRRKMIAVFVRRAILAAAAGRRGAWKA